MDLWDMETEGEISVHSSTSLVRRAEKTTNERKCTREER